MSVRALIIALALALASAGGWLLFGVRAPNGKSSPTPAAAANSLPPASSQPPAPVAARAATRRVPSAPTLPRNLDEAIQRSPEIAKLTPVQRKLVELRLDFLNRLDACLAGRIKGEHHLLSVYELHRVDESTREVRAVLITGPTVNQLPDVAAFEDRELLHNCAQQAGVGQLQPITESDANAGDDVSIPENLELPIARNDYLGG